LDNLIHPHYQSRVVNACIATTVATASLFTPWETTRIISGTMLTGITYSVVNDLFSCRECIEYFAEGIWGGRRLDNRPIRTLDPNWNALIWGMMASWQISALAGCIFAILARIPFRLFTYKLTARQILPYLQGGAVFVQTLAHIASWKEKQKVSQAQKNGTFKDSLPEVPNEHKARFIAVNERHRVGYLGNRALCVALGVVIVTMRLRVIPHLTFRQ